MMQRRNLTQQERRALLVQKEKKRQKVAAVCWLVIAFVWFGMFFLRLIAEGPEVGVVVMSVLCTCFSLAAALMHWKRSK